MRMIFSGINIFAAKMKEISRRTCWKQVTSGIIPLIIYTFHEYRRELPIKRFTVHLEEDWKLKRGNKAQEEIEESDLNFKLKD